MMKVLMITPAVDPLDPLLGFTYTLVNQMAERVDKLYVITLSHRNSKPNGVTEVYSLDTRQNRLSKLFYLNRLLFKIMPQVDVVFTHMYPLFPILIWPCARLFRKPIVMWRCHNGHISLITRLGHALVERVVTASKESFRIRSHKVKIIGHGIDIERFSASSKSTSKDYLSILSVGRISPVKDYETMIEAVSIMVSEYGMEDIKFVAVGGPPPASEEGYFNKIKALVKEKGVEGKVEFIGNVPYNTVPEFYHRADLFVSASQTGSIDKVVLEAMASGKIIVTCNEAFFSFIGDYCSLLTFQQREPHDLAKKIAALHSLSEGEKSKIRSFLKSMVEAEHSLDVWLPRLISVFQEVLLKK